MGKVLLLLIVALVAYVALKGLLRTRRANSGAKPVEDMVACGHCGVNLPKSEAFERRGLYFCSEEHRTLGVR
jgi:uncharacterized protein